VSVQKAQAFVPDGLQQPVLFTQCTNKRSSVRWHTEHGLCIVYAGPVQKKINSPVTGAGRIIYPMMEP